MRVAGQDVARTPRRAGGLLRERNFRLLWIGETVSALGAGLFGLLIPLTGPGAGVAFYIIGWGIDAAGIAMGSIIAASFRQAYCPPSMLGRAIASMRFLGFGSVPFGALAAGGLGTAFGIRSALWFILGIDALSGTILLTPAIRSRKNLPSEPEVSKPRRIS